MAVKLPHYKIEAIKPLGSNPAITGYLKYRGVWEAAEEHHLNEVYYYVEDEKKKRKQFFAAGWRNENGDWEVRNKYFKGCLGRKGMSFIKGIDNRLAIFEGYLDFLSWKLEQPLSRPSILVLNSLSFISPAIDRARNFEEVDIYFDHDLAGRQSTEQLKIAIPWSNDQSDYYIGYNDYNEKHMAEQSASMRLKSSFVPGIFTNLKVGFTR